MKQGQYPISRNPPNELTTAPEPDNIKNSVYLSADIPYENEITLENTQLVDNDEDIESHHFEGVNFDDSHEQSNNKSLFKNNIGNSKQSIKRGTQDVILTQMLLSSVRYKLPDNANQELKCSKRKLQPQDIDMQISVTGPANFRRPPTLQNSSNRQKISLQIVPVTAVNVVNVPPVQNEVVKKQEQNEKVQPVEAEKDDSKNIINSGLFSLGKKNVPHNQTNEYYINNGETVYKRPPSAIALKGQQQRVSSTNIRQAVQRHSHNQHANTIQKATSSPQLVLKVNSNSINSNSDKFEQQKYPSSNNMVAMPTHTMTKTKNKQKQATYDCKPTIKDVKKQGEAKKDQKGKRGREQSTPKQKKQSKKMADLTACRNKPNPIAAQPTDEYHDEQCFERQDSDNQSSQRAQKQKMQHFNQRQHSQEHFNLESQKMKKSTSEKVFKDLFAHNYRYGEPQRVINPNANKQIHKSVHQNPAWKTAKTIFQYDRNVPYHGADETQESTRVPKHKIDYSNSQANYFSLIDQPVFQDFPKRDDSQHKLVHKILSVCAVLGIDDQGMSMIAYPDYVMSQSSQFAGNISLVWYYNGGFYFGNWVVNDQANQRGQKHGIGIQIAPKKYIYHGQFRQGYRWGKGIAYYSTGDNYQGQWVKGCHHGEGIYETQQSIYKGEFSKGKKNGYGVQAFSNGNKYQGHYLRNRFNGQGTFEWANGAKYQGDFKDGSKQGQGCWTSPFGDYYEGEYDENLKHGYGQYYWKSGRSYRGMFNKGRRCNQNVNNFGQEQQLTEENTMDHATEQKNRRKDVINDPRERNMRSNESHGRNMLGEKQVVWQDQRFRKY